MNIHTHLGFIWLVCFLPFLGLGVGMAANKLGDVADQQGKKRRLTDLEYQIKKKKLEQELKDLGPKAPESQKDRKSEFDSPSPSKAL